MLKKLTGLLQIQQGMDETFFSHLPPDKDKHFF